MNSQNIDDAVFYCGGSFERCKIYGLARKSEESPKALGPDLERSMAEMTPPAEKGRRRPAGGQ